MHTNDQQAQQGRRHALQVLAGTGLWCALGSRIAQAENAPQCTLTPEQTEGPYFMDGKLNRADVRTDPATGLASAGIPLQLQLMVSAVQGNRCTPLKGAQVDIWHCDAAGVYSGVDDEKQFLRGFQVTDGTGRVRFSTIYPGWYPGRAVHIHVKVRTRQQGRAHELVSQLYFDDAITDQVYRHAPYQHRPNRFPRNDGDRIFSAGGEALLLKPAGDAVKGYQTTFHLGLSL